MAVNLTIALGTRLAASPCRLFNSDMRLHSQKCGLYTYPDVMVVCSKLRFLERRDDTVLNPLLIVEVLSKTTRDYDRGAKFEFYKGIDTLREYVLIDSESPRVECYQRGAGDQWIVEAYDGMDAVAHLGSLDFDLTLRQIYHKVSWAE